MYGGEAPRDHRGRFHKGKPGGPGRDLPRSPERTQVTAWKLYSCAAGLAQRPPPRPDQSGLRGSIRDARHELSRKNNGAATLCSRMEWVRPDDPWLGPLADWAYFRGLREFVLRRSAPCPVRIGRARCRGRWNQWRQTIKSLSAVFLADLERHWRVHGPKVPPERSFPQARGNHPSMVSDR
jgi:hypothetical protein